jgi:regulator of sigma E protease
MTLLQTIISFLFALTVLIFIHEMGHYLVARWCGVKVLRFSIGFGKPLFTRLIGPDKTEWSFSAIPLGGYVKMLDERDESQLPIAPADLPRAFTRQTLGRRSAIVVAGPIANFLLAIGLYWLLNVVGVEEPAAILDQPVAQSPAATAGIQSGDRIVSVDGKAIRSWNEVRLLMLDAVIEKRSVNLAVNRSGSTAQTAPTTLNIDTSSLPSGEVEKDFLRTLGIDLAVGRVLVASVMTDSAAARAGLRANDEVLRVDGQEIRRSGELIERIRSSAGKPLRFEVLRSAATLSLEVTPDSRESDRPNEAGKQVGRIGAGLNHRVAMEMVRYGPLESLARGAQQTWDMSIFSLRMMGKMLVGQLSWKNLSGPVAIADYAGQSARVGWFAYVSFLALISISLGVLNLLPIPVLDGGHLVYYGLEALRGKPLSDRFVEITQKAGVAIIGALMVVALFNDITRLIGS